MSYLQKKKLAFMSIANNLKGFVRIISGALPLTLTNCANDENLITYSITGNSGGVGDRTRNILKYKGLDEIHTTVASATDPIPDLDGGQLYYGNGTGKFFELTSSYDYGKNYITWTPEVAYQGPAYSVKVKPNTTYKYSHKDENGDYIRGVAITVHYYNSVGLRVSATTLGAATDTEYKPFTTSDDTEFVIFNFRGGTKNTEYTFYDIQLEEGDTVTEYEEYGYKIPVIASNGERSLTTNIYLDNSIGDGEKIIYPEDNIPPLPIFKGTTIFTVGTNIQPASMEVKYYST